MTRFTAVQHVQQISKYFIFAAKFVSNWTMKWIYLSVGQFIFKRNTPDNI